MLIHGKKKLHNTNIKIVKSKSHIHRFFLLTIIKPDIYTFEIDNNTLNSIDVKATINVLNAVGATVKIKTNYIIISTENINGTCKVINVYDSASTLRISLFLLLDIYGYVEFQVGNSLKKRPLDFLENFSIEKSINNDIIKFSGNIKNENINVFDCESSQYISGILLFLAKNSSKNKIIFHSDIPSKGYIQITLDILNIYGFEFKFNNNQIYLDNIYLSDKKFNVPICASSRAYWVVAQNLTNINLNFENSNMYHPDNIIDDLIRDKPDIIDIDNCIDLFPILVIWSLFQEKKTIFINYHRLKLKESNRIDAMIEQLKVLNANIKITDKYIEVYPSIKMSGGVIHSFGDHRIAMSFAIYSLMINEDLKIIDSSVVNKSYFGFFEELKKIIKGA